MKQSGGNAMYTKSSGEYRKGVSHTIDPDEKSPEFMAHLNSRIEKAKDRSNRIPIDEFMKNYYERTGKKEDV
jgi:hypothetical protein